MLGRRPVKPLCVIKIGGAIVGTSEGVNRVAIQVAEMASSHRVVIVHGGGPQATVLAEKLGHVPQIVEGRRVTTPLDLEIHLATVCGVVNSQLVAALAGTGVEAVGISGAAGRTVAVVKRPPWTINGREVDFGLVGDVQSIRPHLIESLLQGGRTPVISSLGIDHAGNLYNVNADTTAAAIAAALQAEQLRIVTDSGGLRREGTRLDSCTKELYEQGAADGWIQSGMLVKLKAGFVALSAGVEAVEIVGPDQIAGGWGTRLTAVAESIEVA